MKKNLILKQSLAVATLLAFLTGSGPAATLIYNFGANTATLTAAYTSGSPVNYSAGNFSIGNSLGTVATPITNTSVSSGYVGASGGENIGNAMRTGAINLSAGGSVYFEFTLTPEAGYYISLSDLDFGARATGTGSQAFALYSSIDSFASSIFTATIANNSTYVLENNTFAAVNGAVNAAVTFRIYGYNGVGAASNNTITTKLDDISVTATAFAVPEPAAIGLAIVGLTSLMIFRRRSKKEVA